MTSLPLPEAPAQPVTDEPGGRPALRPVPGLISFGSDDAPVCADGVCA